MGALPQPLCPPIILVAAAVCLLSAGCRGLLLPTASGILGQADAPAAIDSPRDRPQNAAVKTLPVELLFIRHDPHDPIVRDELWSLVDEQALGRDLSARLAANGLRAGVLSGSLPTALAERVAMAQPIIADGTEDAAASRRVLRLLPGKRAEIVATGGISELVLLEHDSDGVRGGTYRDGTAVVAVRAWPDADGRTRIEAVPELKHGPMQRTWIGEEGMFRLETGQVRRRFESLEIETLLPHRGLLVIGVAGEPAATVGDALLRDRDGAAAGMRLLVIRPLGTGVDPAFDVGDEDLSSME
jgi:hypothetical protein